MQAGRPGQGAMPLEGVTGLYDAAGLPLIEVPPKPQRPRMDISRDPGFPNRVAQGAELRKKLAPFVARPLLDMLVLGRIFGTYPDPRQAGPGPAGKMLPVLKRDVPPEAPDSYIAGFDADRGYQRPSRAGDSIPIEIPNPGAVFDDIESAAKDLHALVDPMSKSLNHEFHWRYYFDNKTGKIGYTDPVDAGMVGGRPRIPFQSNGQPFAPEGVTEFGLGHNHGAYSKMDRNGKIVRWPSPVPVQDDFSKSQTPGGPSDMKTMQEGPDNYVYTLGTPDGKVWTWTKYGGKRRLK